MSFAALPEDPAARVTRVVLPGRILLLRATGEFDIDTAPLLRAALRPGRQHLTIVDLSSLSFADCALLRVLVPARFRSRLVLKAGRRHKVRRLFACTCTDRLFTFAPDVDTALRMAIGTAPPRTPEAAWNGRL
ncbi:STAS domain-containing protein [Streptomyces sp. NPDC001205]